MFEQSVVREGEHRNPVITLPVSLGLHAVALASALFAALWQVSFPTSSPAQFEQWKLERSITLPSGSPVRPKSPSKPRSKPPQVALQLQTPTVIPDDVHPPDPDPLRAIGSFDPVTTTADGGGGGDDLLPGSGNGGDTGPAEPPRQVGGDVKAPVLVTRVEPLYPPLAVKMRLSGFVIVTAIIDEGGNVVQASVLKSTHQLFEQPALDAVQRWKYKAGTLHGRAVATIFNLTVKFRITS